MKFVKVEMLIQQAVLLTAFLPAVCEDSPENELIEIKIESLEGGARKYAEHIESSETPRLVRKEFVKEKKIILREIEFLQQVIIAERDTALIKERMAITIGLNEIDRLQFYLDLGRADEDELAEYKEKIKKIEKMVAEVKDLIGENSKE